MTIRRLETLLTSEDVLYQRTEKGCMASVRGSSRTFDMHCTPFQDDGVRVQVWFPPEHSPHIASISSLCKELEERVEGVEFGFYPEPGNFAVSSYVPLEEGINSNLIELALLCERVSPLVVTASEGCAPNWQRVYLALSPASSMFQA